MWGLTTKDAGGGGTPESLVTALGWRQGGLSTQQFISLLWDM